MEAAAALGEGSLADRYALLASEGGEIALPASGSGG